MIETNGDDVADWIEDQKEEFEEDVDEMLNEATDETLSDAQDQVPVDTGDLKESLQKNKHSVFSDLDYAPDVGLGTIYQDQQDYLWGPAEENIKNALQKLADE